MSVSPQEEQNEGTVMATKALVKPELLIWTRNRARVTVEDAAQTAGVAIEILKAWEKGEDAPTLNQLRKLATKYHFPLAVFYLSVPPQDFAPLRDFRRLPEAEDRSLSPNLAYHVRTAYERRELALELYGDLRERPNAFRLEAKLGDDPEALGQAIRKFLGIDNDNQMEAARRGRAFDFWRRKLEEHDILVFVVSGPHYGVDLEEMRGFALAKEELPVVVVNGKDYSQGGKCYTLLHELTHIILGESAISNGSVGKYGSTAEEQQIERFCDEVAASSLMPPELVLSFPESKAPGRRDWSDNDLHAISRVIGVSREALLLRFVTLHRATWKFYNEQRTRFLEEYRRMAVEKAQGEKKSVAIPRPIMLMSGNGRGFTRLVLRSYYDQRITLNDVSSYLGAKVKYIPALERAAFQAAD
jgi:Zn-dependent peptidase ImmA (M78 family)/DNA-binding XRE family transcriptional regulator